jgi:hypothetical protein
MRRDKSIRDAFWHDAYSQKSSLIWIPQSDGLPLVAVRSSLASM